jgi:tetratricopeptide (TPR) repeat protein
MSARGRLFVAHGPVGAKALASGPALIAGSRALIVLALSTLPAHAAALDLAALWDFRQPELSEQRFRAALRTATGDDALLLQTQIARTHGLRQEFSKAREILSAMAPRLPTASAEVRVRHALETGRTHASATHPPQSQTDESRALARAAFVAARDAAKAAQLDGLAIDALHMLAFVDTAPADQLKWAREALAISQTSSQEAAKKWEASLRNNAGLALHALGRFDEALAEFRAALAIRQRGADASSVRVAHWMVAYALRALGRVDEALQVQLRLERECDVAGEPDRHVYEELELLHRAKGDEAKAARYADLKARAGG